MHQQKRVLDQELSSNNLTRVPTSILKPKLSLFRALSLSIYFDENHTEQIIRVMKLALLCSCNCKYPSMSPFPTPHRKARFLSKFVDSIENIQMYVENPDLQCFLYDNLQLASLGYQKRVILFTVSHDLYLQENLITSCSTRVKEPPIMLAKISNRFFCVQTQATRSVMMFIKQNIVNQMIQPENKQEGGHPRNNSNNIFYYQQQYSPTLRQTRSHKKSLSDCGDIINFNSEQQKAQEYYFHENVQHPHSIQGYEDTSHELLYQGYQMMSPEPRLQRSNSVNIPPNQRHTGRLKFFEPNKNYGFIVVDGFQTDLFVHYDDLQKTGIPKQKFLNIRNSQEMRFQFTCLEYDGKQKKSKKAVDLLLIQ